MDLLIEKDDKRTYLSRYKVITTSFEESSPSVKRNNTQIQYRNGNVDFGGWNESKTIEYVGYYRADDLEDEEYIRERIYALLSDPEGYYITQLKNDNDNSFERPGETSGDYFDKQENRPSHKRFYVYANSLESELVGSYGGHVLYKISATFTTMKLPYGESVPRDLDVKSNVPYYGRNIYLNSKAVENSYATNDGVKVTVEPFDGTTNMWHVVAEQGNGAYVGIYFWDYYKGGLPDNSDWSYSVDVKGIGKITRLGIEDSKLNPTVGTIGSEWSRIIQTGHADKKKTIVMYFDTTDSPLDVYIKLPKLEIGKIPTPWSPAPEDQEYNEWYLDTYYNTDNLVIPYAGTVPCNQLEQGFIIEFTSQTTGANLKISLNGTDFFAPGDVVPGDVFKLSGYEYIKNGISIVKATNKAYFKLLPGVTNKISSSIAGTIRILGYQDLYA